MKKRCALLLAVLTLGLAFLTGTNQNSTQVADTLPVFPLGIAAQK